MVLVLEPSDEAWEGIHFTADELVQAFQGRIEGLYFLGNSNRYPISARRDFKEQIPGWFSKNVGRVSLMGPILETLEEKGFRGMIVIVCTKTPVDAADWIDQEIFERTLFVNKGREPFSDEFQEIDSDLGIRRVIEALDNPVTSLSIEGPSFVPFYWEIVPDTMAKVVYENGVFRLKIVPRDVGIELHLQGISGDILPSLYVERAKGNKEIICGKKEPPWFSDPQWGEIPEGLKPVIEAGVSKQEYKCPQCGNIHKYDTFLCHEGDIVLKGMPTNTCLLFSKQKFFSLAERYAYPLWEGERVITREGNLYKLNSGCWVHLRRIEIFEQVDNEVWGLFHRI